MARDLVLGPPEEAAQVPRDWREIGARGLLDGLSVTLLVWSGVRTTGLLLGCYCIGLLDGDECHTHDYMTTKGHRTSHAPPHLPCATAPSMRHRTSHARDAEV